MTHPKRGPSIPPETGMPARRAVQRALRLLKSLLHVEAASGVLLLVAAVVAVVWANSPWATSYERAWHVPVTPGVGSLVAASSVRFWINDGVMAVFFFVVGLEIRGEIHNGELSDFKRAVLPIAAALGGMLVPALIFMSFNRGLTSQRGWGVPIDDVGAIVVIAIFYSSEVSISGLLLAAGGVAGVLVLQRLRIRRVLAYALPGFVMWLGCLRAGIHPTIAGLILGLLTPATSWGAAVAPVVRLQTSLQPWVAFVIMPRFALANAGVDLRGARLDDHESMPVFLGIVVGLVLGKPVGVLAGSYLLVRLRLAALPAGVTWRGLGLVGCVAGVGFTMAIFIANLAFTETTVLATAKFAVLVASAVAGLIAVLWGRVLPPRSDLPGEKWT